MQDGDEPRLDGAITDIAALLAAAYQRRAQIRLIRCAPESIQSTERLENTGEVSPHELTLTRRRKESTSS